MNPKENTESGYRPGQCNIGPREIGVRRKFLLLTAPVTFAASFFAFIYPASVLLWILLLCTSFSTIILYSEIRSGFCVLFGFFSLHNFKQLGNLDEVKNADHRKSDRRRMMNVILASLALALLYTMAIHFLSSAFRLPA